MNPRVFKQKGSRVYRGRFRIGSSPRIFDVPLHTHIKHVAEARLKTLVQEREEEAAGIARPKPLLEAAKRPLSEHLAEYVADLEAQGCSKKYVALARNRTQRLCDTCGWEKIADVCADDFARWRSKQSCSAKTSNEYLGLASAFLNWLERNGRAAFNPLRKVGKAETRGKERRLRRALTREEIEKLVKQGGKRSLAYLLALYTGLRRGEMKQLSWLDVHLDAPKPYLEVRASTTKNKKTAILPLLPALIDGLRQHQAKEDRTEGKVFRLGVPTAKMLAEDLKACGIKPVDSLGRRVDFHALRHTFATQLNQAGIPPRVVMELMRHSDMRLTHKTYTDATSLALFTELEKLGSRLSSPLASPNPGFSCPNEVKIDQGKGSRTNAEVLEMTGTCPELTGVVSNRESPEVAERVGLHPTLICGC